jgi:hypothetical protein
MKMEPVFGGDSYGFGPAITATEFETRRHRDDFAAVEVCADTAAADNRVRPADREQRASALLKAWLSPEQLAQFERQASFDVTGSKTGKRYRIHVGRMQNVYELDKKGRPIRGWCFTPLLYLPTADIMLAQKIALETDEEATMKVAQPFWARTEGLLSWAAAIWGP